MRSAGTGSAKTWGTRLIPQIEHCDLGGGYVEGVFSIDEIAAFLALQTGLPYETIRARVVESYGYCVSPPKDGLKVIFVQSHPDSVDEQSIRAMRRVVDDFMSAAEVNELKRSYRASEFKDAYWIAWDCQLHPYLAIAMLRNLNARGELS